MAKVGRPDYPQSHATKEGGGFASIPGRPARLVLSDLTRHDGCMADFLTPADLVGKLDTLRVACTKCDRAGRYPIARLIETIGPNANMSDWLSKITADCPRKMENSYSDQCGARCPDVPKVL